MEGLQATAQVAFWFCCLLAVPPSWAVHPPRASASPSVRGAGEGKGANPHAALRPMHHTHHELRKMVPLFAH